ncbi:protein ACCUMULATION AND REPLICATION OF CHLOROPLASTS 3, chloroplastic isoform X2 [Andrographis paniculata]|uniref:protein ACCUMULATION AND REPLICATION OF CHLOROPLASTS 3, chloroplastic isoform X2 n=1 Tax=Andrographis paniculata TaxID=175694 RepID=UPI0021E83F43|nr:protein ACCUMULATION AND REPLICATION OF CHLOROPLASTS 3, chloroplastic isoform X2 [Andrographis paniculata]
MSLLYPNTAGSYLIWRPSEFRFPLLSLSGTREKYGTKKSLRWNSGYLRAKLRCTNVIVSNEKNGDLRGEDGECVEVIVIGSRKDAVLDFCAASPLLTPALRFWNIVGNGSDQVRLQHRFTGQDTTQRNVEELSAWQPSCKAVILVASAAYGLDHVTALEVLSNVQSDDGFTVGIILKPFRFEGQRRQDEVKDLVSKLQKQTNFCIVLDTDTLLENDLVTLDEALRTSNNAVLMAMKAISMLLSEKLTKLLCSRDNLTRELQLPDLRKIFESYSEARIGFGAGHNVKTSIRHAISECPFLGLDIKDCDGVILCIIASSLVLGSNDANDILHTVRSTTQFRGDIIVSLAHEPNLETKTILATVFVFGFTQQKLAPAPRNGILSSLGQHFPFIFNIFKKQMGNPEKALPYKSPQFTEGIYSPVMKNIPDANFTYGPSEDAEVFSDKIQQPSGNMDEECDSLRSGDGELGLSETNDSQSSYMLNYEETHMFKRELLTRGNLGPSHSSEQSKYGTNVLEATGIVDNISIYRLPVGVKILEKFENPPPNTDTKHGIARRVDDNEKKQQSVVPSLSWPGLIDAENNNTTKANCIGSPKKQGVLSVRALSMLESERDSQKKWNRVVEMKYRGGVYRGRTQGGLPEGKGRLLLGDGSIYDGMWRYGKRSGLGTFYFNNGDVFQGSWRDDVMHGKGWIYFHTGDRWFVNFWKGKANGEGRFYSKHGNVFFGHFKEGWRQGQFLRINVDGTRTEELWDEGVLVSERPLDKVDAQIG